MKQIRVPKKIERELRVLGMKMVPFWIVVGLTAINIFILFVAFSPLALLWCLLGSTGEFVLVNYLYEQPWLSQLWDQQLPKDMMNDLP